MKLRLDKDTVKFRLSPDEIKTLKAKKFITEKYHLSEENGFSYSIQLIDHSDRCMVNFKSHCLELNVPKAIADKWMDSNQIGIKETIVTDQGSKIVLFVEEDLPRRKNREKK